VSSLQLTEDPDRVRSFGGYNNTMSGAVAVYERIRKTILIGKTTTTYFYRIAKTERLRPKSFSGSSRN
jgi:hypothetical protein